VAIQRSLLLIPKQGPGQCCAVDIAHDSDDEDLDNAKVLDICPNQTAGMLTKINSGICEAHIQQLDEEGALVLE
jgi:hypothetical protein